MVRAVGELSGHSGTSHWSLALDHLTGLAGCGAGRCGKDNLLHNDLGLLGVLLKVLVHGGGSGL